MTVNYDLSELLRDQHECWVALNPEQTKIVGRGETLVDAEAEARENGVNDPIMIWVPERWQTAVY